MRSRAVFLALLVPVVAACHDEKPKVETSGPASAEPIPSDLVYNSFVESTKPTPTPTESSASAAPTDTGSTAKLDDAGADPKSPLRYAFGTKTRTVDAQLENTIVGAPPGMPSPPPVHLVFTATPKPKSMMGKDATVDIKVTKFDITIPDGAGPSAAGQKAQLEKALTGLTGHFDVTQFGDIGQVTFDTDSLPRELAAASDKVAEALQLLVVPLPNEAVGVGAKWEKSDSKRLADQGATVSMKTVYTLVSRDAHSATIKVEVTGSGSGTDPRSKGATVAQNSSGTFTVVIPFDSVAQSITGQASQSITRKAAGEPDQGITIKETQKITSK